MGFGDSKEVISLQDELAALESDPIWAEAFTPQDSIEDIQALQASFQGLPAVEGVQIGISNDVKESTSNKDTDPAIGASVEMKNPSDTTEKGDKPLFSGELPLFSREEDTEVLLQRLRDLE